jgi:hypothetical protein
MQSGRLSSIAKVVHSGPAIEFQFDEWKSPVGARDNGDGSTSFVILNDEMSGAEFFAGEEDGKQTLTLQEGRVKYIFVERNVR